MTDTFKVLGQSFPAGGVLTDLYTVPTVTSAVISSLTICNQNSSKAKVRVSIAVAGAVDTTKQYLIYDACLLGNETKSITIGETLATTDVFRVYSDTGTVSFNLFGTEVT